MSVVLNLRWPEITPEVYEASRSEVRWEEEPPDGLELHVSWYAADGFHVLDVWRTEDHFERFVEERLAPVIKGKLGVEGDPVYEFTPMHRRFVAPGVAGASS
ncbi:hypothetical protein [Streptomyces sp. GESEQ-4]|uniref:hypothetical protein n=1 Tax=Streptomyces sp. GESEQ-4 TaxID=2812655 RepID=UPI001B33DE73|nr:hypothetical protein [Streptomyces sp. GESEQ-4]